MRLLSPTLLDSFSFFRSVNDEERGEQSRRELINRLRGIKPPPSKAMLRGIQFEQDICDMADGVFKAENRKLTETHLRIIQNMADIVKGASRQVHIGYWLDTDLLIHGYVDFLLPRLIIDTKSTKSYDCGKYLANLQHATYLLALNHLGYRSFAYLVGIFSGANAAGTAVEDYYYCDSMRDTLKSRAADFFAYLEIDDEMREAYYGRDMSVPNDLYQ